MSSLPPTSLPDADLLAELLEASAAHHRHLCPRQVLGVRMGMLAGQQLGLTVPQAHASKRLYTIVETDGCALTGIATATNCWPGRRTLRIEDYGKIAATFVDCATERALRIVPRGDIRQRVVQQAAQVAPEARGTWQAHLLGYQRLADEELFTVQAVTLRTPLARLISTKHAKAFCACCGEEIRNQREVIHDGQMLCQACAGASYYRPA